MDWVVEGEVVEWRGPAPYFFVAMSVSDSADLKEQARSLIYWGQVPVQAVIGGTEFSTALFPRDGRYLVPLKDAVRAAEGIGEPCDQPVDRKLAVAKLASLVLCDRTQHRPGTCDDAMLLIRRQCGRCLDVEDCLDPGLRGVRVLASRPARPRDAKLDLG